MKAVKDSANKSEIINDMLTSASITKEMQSRLKELFFGLPILSYLTLTNQISDAGVEELGILLQDNPPLESISIDAQNLSEISVIVFMGDLLCNSNIKSLNIRLSKTRIIELVGVAQELMTQHQLNLTVNGEVIKKTGIFASAAEQGTQMPIRDVKKMINMLDTFFRVGTDYPQSKFIEDLNKIDDADSITLKGFLDLFAEHEAKDPALIPSRIAILLFAIKCGILEENLEIFTAALKSKPQHLEMFLTNVFPLIARADVSQKQLKGLSILLASLQDQVRIWKYTLYSSIQKGVSSKQLENINNLIPLDIQEDVYLYTLGELLFSNADDNKIKTLFGLIPVENLMLEMVLCKVLLLSILPEKCTHNTQKRFFAAILAHGHLFDVNSLLSNALYFATLNDADVGDLERLMKLIAADRIAPIVIKALEMCLENNVSTANLENLIEATNSQEKGKQINPRREVFGMLLNMLLWKHLNNPQLQIKDTEKFLMRYIKALTVPYVQNLIKDKLVLLPEFTEILNAAIFMIGKNPEQEKLVLPTANLGARAENYLKIAEFIEEKTTQKSGNDALLKEVPSKEEIHLFKYYLGMQLASTLSTFYRVTGNSKVEGLTNQEESNVFNQLRGKKYYSHKKYPKLSTASATDGRRIESVIKFLKIIEAENGKEAKAEPQEFVQIFTENLRKTLENLLQAHVVITNIKDEVAEKAEEELVREEAAKKSAEAAKQKAPTKNKKQLQPPKLAVVQSVNVEQEIKLPQTQERLAELPKTPQNPESELGEGGWTEVKRGENKKKKSSAQPAQKQHDVQDRNMIQAERIESGKFYEDVAIDALMGINLAKTKDASYINAASCMSEQIFSEEVQSFINDKNKKLVVAIIPDELESHFMTILIHRNENGYSITYIDPVIKNEKGAANPAHRIPLSILRVLQTKFPQVKILNSTTNIQPYNTQSDGEEISNHHCGAFASYFAAKIITQDARVSADGRIEFKDSNQEWCRLNDLSVQKSDELGKAIRNFHLGFFAGRDENLFDDSQVIKLLEANSISVAKLPQKPTALLVNDFPELPVQKPQAPPIEQNQFYSAPPSLVSSMPPAPSYYPPHVPLVIVPADTLNALQQTVLWQQRVIALKDQESQDQRKELEFQTFRAGVFSQEYMKRRQEETPSPTVGNGSATNLQNANVKGMGGKG